MQGHSVEDICQVVFIEQAHVLFVCNTKAVEEIVDVGLRKLLGVIELSHESWDLPVLLNGLDDVTVSFELEGLLSLHNVDIVDGNCDVSKGTFVKVVHMAWVTECAIIVGHGPGGSAHHTQTDTAVWVHGSSEGALRTESSLSCIVISYFINPYQSTRTVLFAGPFATF